MAIANWVLTIEYDGTHYYGFQRQRSQPTIQERLEDALERVIGEQVRVTAAGRTDTGVHAQGQVVNFRTARELTVRRLQCGGNSYLPADIAIIDARRAVDVFDARRSAIWREYRYLVLNRPAPSPLARWQVHHVPFALDVVEMTAAASRFRGRHDFRGFSTVMPSGRSTIRFVHEVRVQQSADLIEIWVRANAFLPHQVRTMVGTLLEIGRHKRTACVIDDVLATHDRRLAGETAPPQGLCLMHVEYPEELQ